MGTLDPNDPRLQAPRPRKGARLRRAVWSGVGWCLGGFILGFLYVAEHVTDGETFFIRSRMGLALGALFGFLGFVLPLTLPTKEEREKDG